jgi:phenylalanyl-tRNA synthetase beta chain
MRISYNWLSEYLPETIEPQALSEILTSIGLEVESLEPFESMKGGLKGVVIGKVLTCEQHPNADKLKKTTVDVGLNEPLKIVCGANNVAAGQTVAVATIGATIYPTHGEPMTMKAAKIRGEESQGMICAEDELGFGEDHAGIMILPDSLKAGSPAAEYFQAYNDFVYEIGLTPNRMDAMSHYGVARDICAYLSHHNKMDVSPRPIFNTDLQIKDESCKIEVKIENEDACQRYAGVSISGVEVKESPDWLKNKIKAIGQRPINNIVDITNYILHETGQPLHAFDADKIEGKKIIVKNLSDGTSFVTLDEKERKLRSEDLMICSETSPMCIAGVFGGAHSGVTETTKNIFLESAWFHPISIRRTSLAHGLRTEAATRFEKGVDISNSVNVLKRAAQLIAEVSGGYISSQIVDVYPSPKQKTKVAVQYDYVRKLSGKEYSNADIKNILQKLGFIFSNEANESFEVEVPYSKTDISIPADIVEEIIRIDGLNNIEIPATISFNPVINQSSFKEQLKNKIANYLTGAGFTEILTNSITNSAYYNDETLGSTVKMINSLTSELDVMKSSMLETGLEVIAYNLNRRNDQLRLFEFGKTYSTKGVGRYKETEHFSAYISGEDVSKTWSREPKEASAFQLKGLVNTMAKIGGIQNLRINSSDNEITIAATTHNIGVIKQVDNKTLDAFGIRNPVFYLDINFESWVSLAEKNKIQYKEVSKFPVVQRDLAFVIDRETNFGKVEEVISATKINKMKSYRLFDIYEGKQLGNKKSMAVNFSFADEEKTLTDKEIDGFMNKLMTAFERQLSAEIRK